MALQFIIGRAGAGKTYTLIKEMIDKSQEMPQKKFVAVVPEQYSMETQKEILSQHPKHGCFNIEVTSLTRLAYTVFEEQGITELNVMNDLGKAFVIRKVLEDCKEQLKVYKSKASMMGFTEKVKSVISELRQYNIGENELLKMCEQTDEYPFLRVKLEDINVINNAFNNYIKDKAITGEELLTLMCQYIPKSDFVKNTYFYFDSFTGFTLVQYQVLEQIIRYSPMVMMSVTLPEYEESFRGFEPYELFALSKETIVRTRELAVRNSIDILPNIVIDLESDSVQKEKSRLGRIDEALSFVEAHIFQDKVSTSTHVSGGESKEKYTKETEAVKVCALSNPKAEAEYVAGEISRLIKNKQYRFNDFAVIAGDIEGYYKYIRQAFIKYDIPCFIDHKEDVLSNKYVDGILAALDVIDKDFSHQAVMRFLRLKFMELDEKECDIFENYILKSGRRGYKSYTRAWERVYKFMEDNHLTIVNKIRKEIVDGFEGLRKVLVNRKSTILDKTKALYQFTSKHNMQEKIEKDIMYFKTNQLTALEKEYSQISQSVIDVFDRLVSLMRDEVISNREYIDILQAGLSQIKIGIIPPGIDTVMVGNIERTRLKDTKKILFFVGMNDGIVPNTSSGGGMITDSERDVLSTKNFELAPTTRDNIFKQRIYLYSLFAKPLEQIVLCYSQTGADGTSLRKSYIIGTLLNMFPKVKEEHIHQIEMSPEHITNKRVALQYISENINAFRNFSTEEKEEGDIPYNGDNQLFTYLSNILYSGDDTEKFMKLIVDAGFYNNEKERLLDELARKLYGLPGNIGITRLEGYAKCAYSQFLSAGLKLREREKFSIQAYDIGNLYHQSIQKYFEIAGSEKIDWEEITEEKNYEMISTAVDKVLKDYDNEALEGSARNAFITSQVREIATKTVKVLIHHIRSGKFEPAEYEISLEHGIVDRIDTYETDDKLYVKIIDYKSGKVAFDITKAYHGIQMQLLVYMNDAINYEKKKSGKEVLPAAGLYFNIKDPFVQMSNVNNIVENFRQLHPDDERSDDEILNALVFEKQLPEFQMSGIVNTEEPVITAVDEVFEEGNKSHIVKLTKKKDGAPDSHSQALDQETYIKLIKYVSNKADEMKEQLFGGNIHLNPVEDACRYCAYKGICRFDKSLGDNYRELEKVTYKDIGELLKEMEESN